MIESEFRPVGGHVALDFVNTVQGRIPIAGRVGPERIEGERLVEPRDLLRWAVVVGLVPRTDRAVSRRRAEAPPRALRPVLAFRESLYRVLRACVERSVPDPEDLATVERTIRAARRNERLIATTDGFRWEGAAPHGLERVLFPVARAAEALLLSPELARVRRCVGDGCGWLFLDSSRNGSRRWCSMRDCGNLDKVRRFRRKSRSTRGQPRPERPTVGLRRRSGARDRPDPSR